MQITRITVAVTHMPEMVTFYNAIMDAGLTEQAPFYRGRLAGMDVLFCPNEIAGVEAEQSRHQFRFAVDDLEGLLGKVRHMGVQIAMGQENGKWVAGIRDPDGNTIEVLQRQDVQRQSS